MVFSINFLIVILLSLMIRDRIKYLQIVVSSFVLQLVYVIKFVTVDGGYESYFFMIDEFVITYIARFLFEIGLPFRFAREHKTMAGFFLIPCILTPITISLFSFPVSGALTKTNLDGFHLSQIAAIGRFFVMFLFASCVYEELCLDKKQIINFTQAIKVSFLIVIFFAVLQCCLRHYSMGWPAWLFNVSRSVYLFYKWKLFRLSSSFFEASVAALFYCSYCVIFYILSFQSKDSGTCHRSKLNLMFFLISVLLILMSISSSAWLAFIVILLGLFLASVLANRYPLSLLYMLTASTMFILLIFICFDSKVIGLINDFLVHKTQTISYFERSRSNSNAISILFSTYLLGKGLGTYRASSLAYNFLATIGLVPTLLFFFNIARISKQLLLSYFKLLQNKSNEINLQYIACSAGSVASFLVCLLSKPEINYFIVLLVTTSLIYFKHCESIVDVRIDTDDVSVLDPSATKLNNSKIE